jgi:hypothetical protein
MRLSIVACAALLAAGSGLPAQAGQTELTPFASWRAEFGGSGETFRPSVSFGLQQQVSGLKDPVPAVRFSATPAALLAEFAGIPLAQRQFRLNQEADAAAPSPVEETHWYTHKWIWWVAAGVAATAVVAVAGSNSEEDKANHPTQPNNNPPPAPRNCITNVGQTCLVPQPCSQIPPTSVCLESHGGEIALAMRGLEMLRWLDEGTGQMGDLAAR